MLVLTPAKYAGLAEGDAHVIRNAGGRASDDAIRSLVISHKLLGTREFFVIHHTDCGMEFFTNEVMRGLLASSLETAELTKNGLAEDKSFDAPSTVGGLAFAPKGLRLAISHYNGVTLWFPNMAANGEVLEWAGSHLAVTFSPDNKFLVTAMHEPALHGWRLADHRHMRMTGYPGRVRSMSWSAGGKALATSGADCVIMWPFASKDGPMGKEPAMLAPLQARVSVVACHPRQDILAAGYSDGTILMVRLDRRRRNPGPPQGTRAGRGAGVECQGDTVGVRRRGWRCGAAGAVANGAAIAGSAGTMGSCSR